MKRDEGRGWRVETGCSILVLVALAVGSAAAEEKQMPLRSYARFALDPSTADGLWGEVGSVYGTQDIDDEDLDVRTTFARIVYGRDIWEAGILLPYRDVDFEESGQGAAIKQAGIGDIEVYGKVLPLQLDDFSGGVGFSLRTPSGKEEDLTGTGEVGFLPFGTIGVRMGLAELGAHLGYQLFTDSHEREPLHGWVYGGGLRIRIANMVAVGADVLGNTPDATGSDPDILVAEPTVDVRIPVGEAGVWLRLAGDVGLNSDSPDWGIGGSLAVDWVPR